MSKLSAKQVTFLETWLDVSVPSQGVPEQRDPPGKLLPIWRDAKDDFNDQLNALQGFLKSSNMPLFVRVADAGLNSVTENKLVSLQVSLMDFDSAPDANARATATKKLAAAVGEMRKFVETHPFLPFLENNPFKIKLTLRSTLSQALDAISRAAQL
ncbi:hypothetical protein [Seohaeicola zhoushanensis]|uniref:Uncharacterized protein n=1 Tax=Seohaeicola zhoushanensis TaxID=1569283 RepID=A0A8J3M798_9RHOB|nr:hypothetical protein [Seohaeicola zhoushanensis]GHF45189.1 hypothetical protein GCM10017056_15980 [Seohaeicola zhoushanensis]